MSSRVLTRQTRQPQIPSGIDKSNPLSQGLVFAVPTIPAFGMATAFDLVKGTIPVVSAGGTGSYIPVATSAGVGTNYPNNVSNTASNYVLTTEQKYSGDFTQIVVGQFPSGSTAIAVAGIQRNAGGTAQLRMQPNHNGSGAAAGAFAMQTYDGTFTSVGAAGVITGKPQVFVGRRYGTEHTLWVDGVKKATVTGAVRNVSTATDFVLGNFTISDIYGAGGPVLLTLGYNRALTDAEIVAISTSAAVSPWQIFQSLSRPYTLEVSAGGGVSLALSGSSVTTSAGAISSSQTISRTLAGQQVSASSGAVVPSTGITVGLTGVSTTVSAGALAASQTISRALAGASVTASSGTLAATQGTTLALSGSSSTASAGALGATQTVSRALTGQQVAATAGTISASGAAGQQVALTGASVFASAGAIGIQTSATVALAGVIVVAHAGAVTVAGAPTAILRAAVTANRAAAAVTADRFAGPTRSNLT